MANNKFDLSTLMTLRHLKAGTVVSIEYGRYTFNADGTRTNLPDAMEVNGVSYPLNDANSAARLTDDLKPMFWASCTGDAKNSALYSDYTNTILAEAGINLQSVRSEDVKKLIFNNPNAIKELHTHFCEHKNTQWFAELQTQEEFFKAVLTNVSGFTKLLKELGKYKCQDPLSFLQKMDLERFQFIVENYYNVLSFVAKMDAIYETPLFVITRPQLDTLKIIIDAHYDIGALITEVNKLGYEKPFDTIVNLSQPLLKKLCDNRGNVTALLACFNQCGEADPVSKLLSLDGATYALFCDKQYQVVEILNALKSRNTQKPIDYLIGLGLSAMTVILNSYFAYSSQIKRGVDLYLEFKPTPKIDNNYKPELTAFITLLQQKPSFATRLEGLNTDSLDLSDYKDSFTVKLLNIPVRLDGDLFDLNTLSSLFADNDGYRINPCNGQKFLLRDIQPAKDVAKRLEQLIDSVENSTVNDDFNELRI